MRLYTEYIRQERRSRDELKRSKALYQKNIVRRRQGLSRVSKFLYHFRTDFKNLIYMPHFSVVTTRDLLPFYYIRHGQHWFSILKSEIRETLEEMWFRRLARMFMLLIRYMNKCIRNLGGWRGCVEN